MKLSGLDLRQRDGVTCAPSVAVVAGALLGPAYRAALMGPDARDVGAAGRAWFAGERGRVYAQVSRLWPRRLGTTPGGWPAITARSAPFGVRAPPAAGMNGTPYFRPPYGVHNADIDRVAADLGYTTVTMWSGDVGDSVPENETSLVANAGKSFQPQRIVLIHANLPTVTHCYSQLIDLIQSRNRIAATESGADPGAQPTRSGAWPLSSIMRSSTSRVFTSRRRRNSLGHCATQCRAVAPVVRADQDHLTAF